MSEPARALAIHPEKCTGCKQCELACSWVQTGTFQPSRSLIRVHIFDEQASFAPYTCFQCSEAWCMQACPVNAIGTMFFDKPTDVAAKCDLCAGDPACARACPTDAIEFVAADPGAWIGAFGDKVDGEFKNAVEGK